MWEVYDVVGYYVGSLLEPEVRYLIEDGAFERDGCEGAVKTGLTVSR